MFLLLFILNIGLVGMNYGNFRPPPLGSRGGPGSPLLGISRKGHQNKTLFGIFLKTDKSDWAKIIFNLIVPFLRSFWVVTWLFCDNFFYGTQNGQKWPKMAKNGPKMTQNDVIVRKMTEIDLFHRFEAFLIAQGWLCHFPPVGGSERA